MSAALRCTTCRVTFAPFGGSNATVAANFTQHPCAAQLAGRDESMRPDVVQVRSRRWHPTNRGGAA
jgi:hypothetical protein